VERAGNGVISAHHSEPLHCAESVSDMAILPPNSREKDRTTAMPRFCLKRTTCSLPVKYPRVTQHSAPTYGKSNGGGVNWGRSQGAPRGPLDPHIRPLASSQVEEVMACSRSMKPKAGHLAWEQPILGRSSWKCKLQACSSRQAVPDLIYLLWAADGRISNGSNVVPYCLVNQGQTIASVVIWVDAEARVRCQMPNSEHLYQNPYCAKGS
jgi:hypothetical protein